MPPSLVSLPPELRLYIYAYIISPTPLSRPASSYIGLLYSCKLIRREFEPEILKRMIVFLKRVQSRCANAPGGKMHFEEPRSLRELVDLKVDRPDGVRPFSRDDPLMALMYMHFNTLTIYITTLELVNKLASWISQFSSCDPVAVKKIELRLFEIPQVSNPNGTSRWVILSRACAWKDKALRDKDENLVGMEYVRKLSKKRKRLEESSKHEDDGWT